MLVLTSDVVNLGLWKLFPAINCDRVENIPTDYPGPIGVPFTVMPRLNPAQFELVGMLRPQIGERALFKRLIIRHLRPELPEVIDLTDWLKRASSKYELVFDGEDVTA